MPKVPEFIKKKGCFNCNTYLAFKDIKEGKSDCQLHELMTSCLLEDCTAYGYSVLRPFVHPDEIDEFVIKRGNVPEEVERAATYRKEITTKFGKEELI